VKVEMINPPGVFHHPAFEGVASVTHPERILFFSGRTSSDLDYNCVGPGDYAVQYRTVMKNLDIEMKAVGARWEDVLYRRIFVLDVDKFLEVAMDPEATSYMPKGAHAPSTMVGVTRLSNPDFVIEIDLVVAARAE
jgi:enamine deaminase RidA (YjgF/YER057c/UK114 family)